LNIFASNISPRVSAMALDNKRCVKMILESAQILSTASSFLWPNKPIICKPCFINHPVNKWARASPGNYFWLYIHFLALLDSYTVRYNKIHAYATRSHELYRQEVVNAQMSNEFCNCTIFKEETDVCLAYRKYLYLKWQKDKRPPVWSNIIKPSWSDAEYWGIIPKEI